MKEGKGNKCVCMIKESVKRTILREIIIGKKVFGGNKKKRGIKKKQSNIM